MLLPTGNSVRLSMPCQVIVSSLLQDVTYGQFRPIFSLPCLTKMSIVAQVKSSGS